MSENKLAIMKKDVVDVVEKRVDALVKAGKLQIPKDYAPENAMKSAWLTLVETKDRSNKPVLSSCTRDSIANALLDMVVQGLTPAKKQCYFIAYGQQLTCQRSYFGTMAVAKRVDPTISDILAQVVYEGDTFTYSIERGKKVITKHEQSLGNVDKKKIIGAYCMILDQDGEVRKTEIMTWDEILQSWKQSQVKPVNDNGSLKAGSTHAKYPAQMAMRTVINRACKPIVNSSSDTCLVQAFNRAADAQADQEVTEEIEANANSETIEIMAEDIETEEKPAENAEKQPEKAEKTEEQQKLDGPGF